MTLQIAGYILCGVVILVALVACLAVHEERQSRRNKYSSRPDYRDFRANFHRENGR